MNHPQRSKITNFWTQRAKRIDSRRVLRNIHVQLGRRAVKLKIAATWMYPSMHLIVLLSKLFFLSAAATHQNLFRRANQMLARTSSQVSNAQRRRKSASSNVNIVLSCSALRIQSVSSIHGIRFYASLAGWSHRWNTSCSQRMTNSTPRIGPGTSGS